GEESLGEAEPIQEPSPPAEPTDNQPSASEEPPRPEPPVEQESSVEAVAEPSEGLPGSPELLPEMESHGQPSSEVEPQGGSESLGSIEDPDAPSEGPDHGI
ncbi:MAG: hypothetical protein JWP08_495, partial [Bryobacterales bacterium]|nr:hypothetical protein [Bryobacterales bacterium]